MLRMVPFLFSALLTLFAPSAKAFEVGPMSVALDPDAGRSYATVVARNSSDRTVAVETYVQRRSPDGAGGERLTPADDNFLIFPPIVSMAPGASQAFRIQWLGEPVGAAQDRYYVTVKRLPISLQEAEAEAGPANPNDPRFLLRLGVAFRIAVDVGS